MWQMRMLANISALLHVWPCPCLHETKNPPLETTQKNSQPSNLLPHPKKEKKESFLSACPTLLLVA